MKNVMVIRHIAFEDLGSLADVLKQRNYHINYFEAGADELSEIDSSLADLMIVLGGPIGAYDEQDYPFLLDELRLLEGRLANDQPTLGICLGAQLMARVLGAKVYPGAQGKEIGWSPITLNQAGQQSALRHLANADAVLHWHGDTFDLPPNCTHLAVSTHYQNQAFTYKQNSMALQFHPEVTPYSLERWFIGHSCEISATTGVTVSKLRQDTQRYSTSLYKQATMCWNSWFDQIERKSQILETTGTRVPTLGG